MTDYYPMEDAPSETPVYLLVAGDEYRCVLTFGYLDSEGRDCCCWEHRPENDLLASDPPGWCGGTCWEVNDEGVPSAQPEGWRPA